MKATSPMKVGRIPTSESSSPAQKHQNHHRSPRLPKENVDPNLLPQEPRPSKPPLPFKNRSPLPPRPPPPGNPLKRKLNLESAQECTDSGVQVILRMRRLREEEEGNAIVQKISPYSVAVLDHSFTFDSVADTSSTQEDIFHLVGVPLVENCLEGFNSSIFAYGQTGSGKTYTMWGPLSALSKDESSSTERGLTPRVFELLFARVKEEQIKHCDKHLNYQCRCSFLEIYNEQITDLLDPSHGSLQIREDVKTGIYVENLTEDYVSSTSDVMQLLMKGLENRRIGETSINAESSRSHCVFTCIVESQSKSISDGLSSIRTSRINLVDLAGSERQKQTGAAGNRLKEAGNINRSLSQLGNLINILAEISQSGKQRHIPYRDSRLTFLLQESLGGNAKLAMICAISPSQSCKSETFSTLRFAQRAKAIKNKAVVNEVTHDDVNVLREQIRQLKDELLRMKSNGGSNGIDGNFSTGWNARRSLTILRRSLGLPMAMKHMDDDNDEEMEIDEADVEKPYDQANSIQSAVCEKYDDDVDKTKTNITLSNQKPLDNQELPSGYETSSKGNEQACDMEVCESEVPSTDQANICKMNVKDCEPEKITEDQLGPIVEDSKCCSEDDTNCDRIVQGNSQSIVASIHASTEEKRLGTSESSPLNGCKSQKEISSCLSIVPSHINPVTESPASSLSPKAENCSRKSPRISLSSSASREVTKGVERAMSGNIQCLVSNNFSAPTEQLAKSIHHGLQIFDLHQQRSSLRRSCLNYTMKTVDRKPSNITKIDCGIQTMPQESQLSEDRSLYICSQCKKRTPQFENNNDASADRELQLVPVDDLSHSRKSMTQVPKAVEKVLAGAIRREMALEDHCAKQAAEITHLNRLVQQYKHERECNIVIEQTREGKISRLEGLMDGIIPAEHFIEDEFISLANEHKMLKEKFENHPEVLRLEIELRRARDELDVYKNFFDLGEKEVLIEEIQDFRCQLQYYVESPMVPQKRKPLLKLTCPAGANKASFRMTSFRTPETVKEECIDEKLQEERRQWTETESKWISLAEELRLELEATRSLSEKQKVELDSERKCLVELKDALQTAMQGHACILDQYADLQEKHVQLLARHRKIRDGITDVKKAAARAGVKGVESKFIDALAAEIAALKAEREKERQYWKDENKGLEAQLRDTAEAVRAAGELLVRLKEAEEMAAHYQKRIDMAEKEVERCHLEIDNLRRTHANDDVTPNQFLAESRLPREAPKPACCDAEAAKYDSGGSVTDQRWKEEFEPFSLGSRNDFSRGAEHHSWFSDYDRCNI